MIKHVVLLNWKSNVTQDQIDSVGTGLKQLSHEIPEIKAYEFGPDAGFSSNNADYALIAEFASESDFETYVKHPKHQVFLTKIAGPILDSFQATQFLLKH